MVGKFNYILEAGFNVGLALSAIIQTFAIIGFSLKWIFLILY